MVTFFLHATLERDFVALCTPMIFADILACDNHSVHLVCDHIGSFGSMATEHNHSVQLDCICDHHGSEYNYPVEYVLFRKVEINSQQEDDSKGAWFVVARMPTSGFTYTLDVVNTSLIRLWQLPTMNFLRNIALKFEKMN